MFEEENHRYRVSDYEWRVNKNGNLKGYLRGTEQQKFTWQPHGSQFTVHAEIPSLAKKFTIKKPKIISKSDTLVAIGFDKTWVTIHT